MKKTSIDNSALGQKTQYTDHYDQRLLHPIPRSLNRIKRNITTPYAFSYGYDTWNAYEISWLNPKGKPEVRIGHFIIPFNSKNIIESKSFKLYLNSFNNTSFPSEKKVLSTLQSDLSLALHADITVTLYPLDHPTEFTRFDNARCLDTLDITTDCYTENPDFLVTQEKQVHQQALYTNLLKSNCLVTHQPDWGTLFIEYSGKKICEQGLLKYIISLRNDNEFHEDCVEHIFTDIYHRCSPTSLTVYAKYTRRGGLDINPIRSTKKVTPLNATRTARQ